MTPVFKSDKIRLRFNFMHPTAQRLLLDMVAWAHDNGIQAIVTETATTKAEDEALKRVSSTHREGRAFDISTKGWQLREILAFQEYFNARESSIAALGHDGTPRLIVHHDAGTGAHFHVQLNRAFTVNWEEEHETVG